ncbi:uncharacterized protein LOC117329732 [Pecten maximus]|uniref:uncharacterized protein LOC117329732 n=1 Tax=Pecten maximus TaxID=6579 RepID=UPI0014584FA2|nr:uncharacterized protein LOC117329732 [Pecten maximus]
MSPLIAKLVDGSPWIQSGRTNIQYTQTKITGMAIVISSQTQSNWTYVEEEPDLILYRSDRRFNVDGQLQYGFLCMAITYEDSNHVYYHLWSGKRSEYSTERIHFSVKAESTFSECCCPKYDIPSLYEYKVLSKPGASTEISNNVQLPLGNLPNCLTEEEDNSMIFSIIFGIPSFVAVLGCVVVIRNLVPQLDNHSSRSSNGRKTQTGSMRSDFGEIQV